MSKIFALLLVAFVCQSAHAGNWTVVDHDYLTIAIGCAFQTPVSGWVAGSTSSMVPKFLHTNDAGQNFTVHELGGSNAALMSLGMSPGAKAGVAGALGAFSLTCGAFTTDGGNTWQKLPHNAGDIVCAFQSAVAPTQNDFYLAGSWSQEHNLNATGLRYSHDGGKTWRSSTWGQSCPARYSSFLNSQTGYISGGEWPADDEQDSFNYRHSRFIARDSDKFSIRSPAPTGDLSAYAAVISVSRDGGQSYTMVWNASANGVYFNEISCISVSECWVTAEGESATNPAVAYIYHTTNGFNTVERQLSISGSLTSINMLNATVGFAGGAVFDGNKFAGVAYSTVDGKTWKPANTLNNFYFMQVSTVDENNAYGAGVTSIGFSSLARYQN